MTKRKKYFLWFLFLFIRYGLIYLGAWQVDIVVKDYIWARRFDIFYFWFWQLCYWDAYALFFWTYALGAFLPEIVFVVKKLSDWRVVLVD